MRILHVVESLFKFGGANVACINFANKQAEQGHKIIIFSTAVEPDLELSVSQCVQNVVVCQRVELKIARLRYVKDLDRTMKIVLSKFQPDIVHVHALWDPVVHSAIKNSFNYRIPIIHSPHGMLTPWALKNKKVKKMMAWYIYQYIDLKKVSAFHVTCKEERNDLSRLGLQQPIKVVPLGTDIPNVDIPRLTDSHMILFMSRIHPGKGLLNLVEAWNRIRKRGWKIVVCGPDDDDHLQLVQERIELLNLQSFFIFKNSVSGQEKDDLFRQCDLFVLPTYSENFGIVILEALSYGMPVITTVGSPWSDIRKYEAGWWIDIGVESLSKALNEYFETSVEKRKQMSINANRLAKEQFSWEIVISNLLESYNETITNYNA